MPNELLDSSANKNRIFFVLQDSLMAFGSEDSKETRDYVGSSSELILTSLIQTKRAYRIGNRLNYLEKVFKLYARDNRQETPRPQ